MDLTMMRNNISPIYYKMYSAVSFFLAGNYFFNYLFIAKSIELDERIPFIPRLKRKCEIR